MTTTRLSSRAVAQEPLDDARFRETVRTTPRTIATVNPDGTLTGPFEAWARHPRLGERLLDLGAELRAGAVLSPRHRELAILVVASRWKAAFAWWAHRPLAERFGLSAEVISAIEHSQHPPFDTTDDEIVFRFVEAMLTTHAIGESDFRAIADLIGEHGIVELIVLVGQYLIVAMTLAVFEVDVPEPTPPPAPNAPSTTHSYGGSDDHR